MCLRWICICTCYIDCVLFVFQAEPKMSPIKLSPENLKALDNHLRDYSFVEGWQATHSDNVLSNIVASVIESVPNYVHISRWWKHIKTYDMAEFQGMARTVEDILGMFGVSAKTVRA